MGWIDVEEPFSTPPRLVDEAANEPWPGGLDIDRGWAEIVDTRITTERIELEDCDDLSITGSVLSNVSLADESPGPDTTVWRSTFADSDLSPLRFRSIRASSFVGCKFSGTDLADSRLEDVRFERCTFRYVNLRLARLKRVEFVDCQLDDVDVYNAELEDVAFPMSRLTTFNVDATKATRVDLRDVAELTFATIGRLDGWLIGEDQLATIMHSLAFAVGLGVERPTDL